MTQPRNTEDDYAHIETVLREAINDAYRLGIGAAIQALRNLTSQPWTDQQMAALHWCISHLCELSLTQGARR